MTWSPKPAPAYAGINSLGQIVIGVLAPCGCCHYERELTEVELRHFVAQLHEHVEISKRVLNLPLPWIHDGGQA